MKQKLTFLLALLCMICMGAWADDVEIASLSDLQAFRDAVNSGTTYEGQTVTLTADIDMSSVTKWTPIGTQANPFKGSFDGGNHTISNMNVSGENYCGFFGCLQGGSASNKAFIKDLTIKDSWVIGTDDCGVLTGYAGYARTISGVTINTCGISAGGQYTGGIAGNSIVDIDNCKVISCTISGHDQVGGIVGYLWIGTITNCEVSGDHATVRSDSERAGGLVGKAASNASNSTAGFKINNNKVVATVNAPDLAGGIAAQIMGDQTAYEIKNNTIDASLVATKVSPIATLRASQDATFTNALAANITGNTWTESTYNLNTYTYTAAETGTTDQVIYNGERTVVAKIGTTEYYDLAEAIKAAIANNDGVAVDIVTDITYEEGVSWTPIPYSIGTLTINGNGYTITNLPGMLLDKQGSGGHFLTVKNLTFEKPTATSIDYGDYACAAVIVGYADCMNLAYFENVHIDGATVTSGNYAGAFIGYAAGYNNTGDGPVYQEITFKNCSVTNSTITGAGSTGALIGHAAGNTWASITVDGTTVKDNTITSTGSNTAKAGSLFGTIGAAGITADLPNAGVYVNATVSGNTVTSGGATVTTIYGRQGTETGTLRLTAGGSYDAAPIAEADASWASCVEGCEVVENADGTYTVAEAAKNFYQDADDANLWHIANLAGLQEFAAAVNAGETYSGKTIILDADIDMSSIESWTPMTSFAGTFNGNNKTISNLTITGSTGNSGLFAALDGATVKDLTIDKANITVTSGNYAGILAGQAHGTITNVTISNSTLTANSSAYVGALCGSGYPNATNCTITKNTISGKDQVGAAVGYLWVGSIINCTVTENSVTATEERAGALIGKIQISSGNVGSSTMKVNGNTISGSATAPDYAGGIAAQIMGDISTWEMKDNTIDVTLSAGKVSPIGVLRSSQSTTFTGSLEANITGDSWTEATYPQNTYTYTAEETGTDEQIINNATPFSTVVAKIGTTEYTDLAEAIKAAISNNDGVAVDIVADITYDEDATWTSIPYSIGTLTINGNGHTITNLPGMLLDKQGSGGHFLTVKDLTFESPKAVNESSDYVAVIVGYADCMNLAYFENVNINNATVKSGNYAGAFIGYAAGYNNTGDGPVYQEITFKNCSVTNSTITGAGSTGALIGHACGNTWASVTVDGTTVTKNTITSTGSNTAKAGSLFGTIGAAGITDALPNAGVYVCATVSGNTVTSGGTTVTTIYGRQGTSTGTLRMNPGGSYDNVPIAEADASWASCVEGYEVVELTDGTYTVAKAKTYVAQIGDTKYETLDEALNAAVEGDVVEILVAGDYTIPSISKKITVKADVDGVNYPITAAYGCIANYAGVTFDNISFTLSSNVNYCGFNWNTDETLTFKNCTFTNRLTSYGNQVFENCTFNQSAADYCMWCYGKDISYTGCTFNTAGKALNVYCESNSTTYNVTVTGCTFNSTVKNKPAINVKETGDNSMLKYNVVISNCTIGTPDFYPAAADYDASSTCYVIDPLVQVDDRNVSATETGITVTLDGTVVYPVETKTYVAQIGDTKYETLDEAVTAAQEGETIEVLVADTYTLPNIPLNVTIKGDVDGVVFNCEGSGSICSVPNGCTFNNVTFNFGTNDYHGFQHAGTINMENCTLNGKLFSYGVMNFTGCTFNAPTKDYAMWNYGTDNTYTNCTFNTTGKALNVYCESNTTAYNITLTGCKFINTGDSYKAAVNVKETCGSTMLKYNVTISDCETEGNWPAAATYDATSTLYVIDPLVQVDDRNVSATETGITVTLDDVVVYPVATPVPCNFLAYKGSATNTETVTTAARWNEILAEYPNAVGIADATNDDNVTLANASKNVVLEYAVGSNGNKYYECPNFVLTDRQSSATSVNFYSPVDFTAVSGSYTRTFYENSSTCCVPFELSTSDFSSSVDILTFAYYEPIYEDGEDTGNAYAYFNKRSTIGAGIPCLIFAGSKTPMNKIFNNTEIKANPENSTCMQGTFTTTDAYKKAGYYGTNSDGTKLAPASTATLYPFRSVVCLLWDSMFNGGSNHDSSASAKPLSIDIAIIDEWGDATAIDGTPIDNVVPGAKDGIYTINGVKVNEAKKSGLYIINGKKTFIK